MTRRLLALVAGALLGFGVGGGAAAAAEVKERTTYFTVRGSTLEDLDRELNRKGPLMSQTGVRHPGATEVKFDGHVTYREADGRCRVATTGLGVHLVRTLPRWNAPKSASAETRIVWKTLSDDIARHEADHMKIAKLWLKKMESAVRNLQPEKTCDAMEARVSAVTASYLHRHEQAQIEFDKVEGRDMNTRLRRLLKQNITEAMSQ